VVERAAEARYLPRGNFVVGVRRETTITAAEAAIIGSEAASIAASITTEASVTTESSVATKAASIPTKTATKTIVGLVVSTVVPVDLGGILRLELLKEVGNVLLGLDQDLAEVFAQVLIAVVVEGGGLTLVANTRGPTDAMHILGDATVLGGWEIVVDDMLDIGDIETTSSDTGSYKNGATASSERAPSTVSDGPVIANPKYSQSVLALTLRTI
jgi:hypothetical protein